MHIVAQTAFFSYLFQYRELVNDYLSVRLLINTSLAIVQESPDDVCECSRHTTHMHTSVYTSVVMCPNFTFDLYSLNAVCIYIPLFTGVLYIYYHNHNDNVYLLAMLSMTMHYWT